MIGLTIVFPVKNEATNLQSAIPAVSRLGNVLVVDSHSADNTIEVAEGLGADVLAFQWNGQFPKKRNWVLRNYTFKTEWVLFLDADEIVSPQFCEEVREKIQNTPHNGFWLNFENHFMGKVLRHGDRMRKLALFRFGAGEYERIEEDSWSHLDMEVHEHPVIEGSVGEIKALIVHKDYRGIKHWIDKHNSYSDWEANRWACLNNQGAPAWEKLNARQQKKYRHLSKWWFAPAYFVASYVLKKGFLDGKAGLHFALLKAFYFFQIRLKIQELKRRKKGEEV